MKDYEASRELHDLCGDPHGPVQAAFSPRFGEAVALSSWRPQ
jgi:hypothetical protein